MVQEHVLFPLVIWVDPSQKFLVALESILGINKISDIVIVLYVIMSYVKNKYIHEILIY